MVTGCVTMSTAGDVARGFSRGVTRFALPFPTAARRSTTSTGVGRVLKRKRRRSVKKGRKRTPRRPRRRHAHR